MLSLLRQLTCCQDTELQTKGPINKVNTGGLGGMEDKQGLPGMGLKASLQKVCLIVMDIQWEIEDSISMTSSKSKFSLVRNILNKSIIYHYKGTIFFSF